MDLTCPKCQGAMRTYERNGVHVDQCGDCRGIFLDRGELERLVDAENAWHGGTAPASGGGGQPSAAGSGAPGAGAGGPGAGSGAGSGAGAGGLGAVVGEVLQQARARQHAQSYPPPGYPQYGYPRKRKKSFLEQLFD